MSPKFLVRLFDKRIIKDRLVNTKEEAKAIYNELMAEYGNRAIFPMSGYSQFNDPKHGQIMGWLVYLY